MVSITVIVEHLGVENQTFKLTVPREAKVWQLTLLLEWGLGVSVSALIAVGDTVLVGDARLQPVGEGVRYTLTAFERPSDE